MVKRRKVLSSLKGHPQIKNIIAIASGKGGVGKSTVSANLALALSHLERRVGILDADIYGPSQPQLFGSYDTPELTPEKKLKPLNLHGIQMMSIGNLVDLDRAIIWRGPMISKALQQIMNDTLWDDLDYLIIDLPPGTGDIQLTLSEKIPVAGSVIVTTPQDLALLDAKRAVTMFNKVKIPILGAVENMSGHQCAKCEHIDPIFGQDTTDNIDAPLLGKLPLHIDYRIDSDSGIPTVAKNIDSALSQRFINIAQNLETELEKLPQDFNQKLPGVKVE